MSICRICGGPTRVTHTSFVLGRHEVRYHLCSVCEFWCTDEPTWLSEAYGAAIASTDTGIAQRNLQLARMLPYVLDEVAPVGPYVDWAGGHGLLVRLMRDAGYDFYWQDRYAENLLARGYEWDERRPGTFASAVTAVEALEHAVDPVDFVQEALKETGSGTFLFTQELHDGTGRDPDWWYLAPKTGQHVSFFSPVTLEALAERLGMRVHTTHSLHMLTTEVLPRQVLRTALRRQRNPLTSSRPRPSLTQQDHLERTDALP